MLTLIHTHNYPHPLAHSPSHTQRPSHLYTLTTHTFTLTLVHAHTQSTTINTRTCSLTHAHPHTHALTHAYPHTRSLTHPFPACLPLRAHHTLQLSTARPIPFPFLFPMYTSMSVSSHVPFSLALPAEPLTHHCLGRSAFSSGHPRQIHSGAAMPQHGFDKLLLHTKCVNY